jgi:hypothetical protein
MPKATTPRHLELRNDRMATDWLSGEYRSMEVLGKKYGLTRERVRQVLRRYDVKGRDEHPKFHYHEKIAQVCLAAPNRWRASMLLHMGPERLGRIVRTLPEYPEIYAKWSEHPPKEHYSDEQLIDNVRQIATDLGRTPSQRELNENGLKISHTTYYRRFGNWAKVCDLAGLPPRKRLNQPSERERDPNTPFRKRYCPRGHDMYITRNKWGQCQVCARRRAREYYWKKIGVDMPPELNGNALSNV